ncbi:MAG: glycosyltransferase family 1 protein [Flavobacterium sp.]|nr:MAG: glycosyltransferase family 1 protein [Flavobacterium sp.]
MNHNASNSQELKEANKSVYFPVTSVDFTVPKQMKSEKFNVLSIDRFGSLMEFNLTINAFINFVRSLPKTEQYNCKLTLIGTRDEKELYQKIIVHNDAKDRIEILDCMDQKTLMQKYQNAKVILFPSHEAAGIVIAEALSFSLPVICLDNDHPGQYITDSVGIALPNQAFNETVNDLKLAFLKLYKFPNLTEIMSNQARKHFEENYIGESRGTHLKNSYDETA